MNAEMRGTANGKVEYEYRKSPRSTIAQIDVLIFDVEILSLLASKK